MVLDEPSLDAAGTGHPFDGHRPGAGPQSSSSSANTDLCICRPYEVGSGSNTPVAEFRSTRTDRAAASISATVTAPDPVGPGFDLVQTLADRERRPDDIGRAGQAVTGIDRGRLHALLGAPELVRRPLRPAPAGGARHRSQLPSRQPKPLALGLHGGRKRPGRSRSANNGRRRRAPSRGRGQGSCRAASRRRHRESRRELAADRPALCHPLDNSGRDRSGSTAAVPRARSSSRRRAAA